MPLIPVSLPMGFYKNGTPYSAKNRWADGNLVRWKDGSLRAIGGWEQRQDAAGVNIPALYGDATIEAPRNALSWEENDGNANLIIGTNRALYHISGSGAVTTVTPAGFTPGNKDETVNTGYGGNFYGLGFYGTPRTELSSGSAQRAFSWELDTWGEDALASERGTGAKLYEWSIGDPAFTVVAGAPTGFNGFCVTDHRFVMLFGATSDPRLVQWCDRENYSVWTPATTNQAGFKRLEGKGALISGWNILDGTLILSETDAYFARYVNPPYVYGFRRVGVDCGPISPLCIAINNNIAMWPGRESFFMFDGQLRPVECDVIDYFLADKSSSADSKITSMHNPNFHEFWWLYASGSSTGEPDSYICYNYLYGTWTVGRLNRTVGINAKAMRAQIMVDPDGVVYNHELAGVAPIGATPYAVTGPIELGDGQSQMMVQRIYPDEQTLGDVDITLLGRDMPTGVDRTYGPYTLRNPTPTRARGREIRMRVDQKENGWEVGNRMRFEVADVMSSSTR